MFAEHDKSNEEWKAAGSDNIAAVVLTADRHATADILPLLQNISQKEKFSKGAFTRVSFID
jgi:hypothetical protein